MCQARTPTRRGRRGTPCACARGHRGALRSSKRCPPPPPPPSPRTKWTRRVPHPVLIGHAASLTPYESDTPRPSQAHRVAAIFVFQTVCAQPTWGEMRVRFVRGGGGGRDVRPVCTGGGEMCVRFVPGGGRGPPARIAPGGGRARRWLTRRSAGGLEPPPRDPQRRSPGGALSPPPPPPPPPAPRAPRTCAQRRAVLRGRPPGPPWVCAERAGGGGRAVTGGVGWQRFVSPRTNRTRLVPPLVLTGHVSSLL